MDVMIDVTEQEAQGVAIRRQKRRVPFEIINILLTVICLASAGLVVYKLCQPEGTDVKEPFTIVIHAAVKNISKGIVYMQSDNTSWVHDDAISAPCDGIYLIYAQVKSEKNSTTHLTIEKKTDPSSKAIWPLGNANVNHPLVTASQLRRGNSIYMWLNQSDTLSNVNAFLGLVLLKAQPDMKSCQENMQMNL